MDGSRFDDLSRRFALSPPRRAIFKSAAGVLLAKMALGEAPASAATVKRAPGEICRKHGDCASKNCGPKDKTGRSRCLCTNVEQCPQPNPGPECLVATCTKAGVCVNESQPEVCNPYGDSACETAATFCAEGMPTCGNDPNCWAMPTTSGLCACSASPGRSHRPCSTDSDCEYEAICDTPQANACVGDEYLQCSNDEDCASLATCIDGACGGQICQSDADCETNFGAGTVCISGEALPCTAGGANICWTLCTGLG